MRAIGSANRKSERRRAALVRDGYDLAKFAHRARSLRQRLLNAWLN
jgi:hypothetical protein